MKGMSKDHSRYIEIKDLLLYAHKGNLGWGGLLFTGGEMIGKVISQNKMSILMKTIA